MRLYHRVDDVQYGVIVTNLGWISWRHRGSGWEEIVRQAPRPRSSGPLLASTSGLGLMTALESGERYISQIGWTSGERKYFAAFCQVTRRPMGVDGDGKF
jgi:hypothetical protein